MKLLYKTTRNYLIASISIMGLTGIALFLSLRNEVGAEMNEQLELQVDDLFESVHSGKLVNNPFMQIHEVSSAVPFGRSFGDSMIYDRVQKVHEEYHYLREVKQVNGARYEAMAMTSHIGWDRYYLNISYMFLLMAVLLTGSGVLINYLSNKHIWEPFFQNLKNVRKFSVSSQEDLHLSDSSIDEFKELNITFKDLADRSRKEYLALREFTENASHEIQTPLSIIRSKLDRMSQMEISGQMAEQITQARSGVDRLSKMNSSLLLLAKLDNTVFGDRQQADIKEFIETMVHNMEDLFITRHIVLHADLEKTLVDTDPYLAETLISNLLSNALRYTPLNGQVKIELKQNKLLFANTGPEPDFEPELIFERFKKSQSNIHSTGLGLAIVKEICKVNNWEIGYQYHAGWHCFDVHFSASPTTT